MFIIKPLISVRSVLALDNVKTTWWQSHRPTTRRLAQLYSALLYNAHLRGFIDGEIYQGAAKYACVPGFNCYSCPGAVGACPLGSIQNALASTGHRAGWYVLGIILLFGLILGRTICGWFCPLGLIQELLHKIPTPKLKKSRITRALSYLKYVILAVFVIAIPLWYGLAHDMPLPGFCKYICPAGTFEGAMGLLSNPNNTNMFSMLGILFTRKFVIMLIIGLACIFCYRSFCRFICPLGAIYGLFNRFNVIGVKVDSNRCNHCGNCVRNCGMDVRHVGDHECINCAKCMEVCNQKAISLKAGTITLKAPEGGCADDKTDSEAKRKSLSRIIWGVALAVLCFALIWFNWLDPALPKTLQPKETSVPSAPVETVPAQTEAPVSATTETYESEVPVGYDIGNQLADFTITCLDGSEFHLADTRGKVTFVNLWATYCTPCVQELPHFIDLYKEHEGDIAMIAVHSSLVTDDPAEYVKSKEWTDISFAVDTDDDLVFGIVNGSSTLPQTIVLNRSGEVIYNQKGSVTPEMLEALYEQASGGTPVSAVESETAPANESETAPAEVTSYSSEAPVGYDIGNQLADFTITCLDGSEFHLADTRGKVTFVNLWATYCTPCVQELPHFIDLYKEHEGDIAMIAVHSSLVTDDPAEYVKSKEWTDISFAVDTDDDLVFGIVNGSSTLPQTIVLNRSGEVIYNQKGSVTPEMLEALYEQAKG